MDFGGLRTMRTSNPSCARPSRLSTEPLIRPIYSSESDSKVIPMFSGPGETAREDADAGDQDPSLGAGDGRLEVLGEAAVTSEPGEGAFDHPSLGLGFEGADTLRSRDNLDRPLARIGERVEQLLAAVDAIGEDMAQLGEPSSKRSEQRHSAMIVLDVGRVHQHGEQR